MEHMRRRTTCIVQFDGIVVTRTYPFVFLSVMPELAIVDVHALCKK